MRIPHHPEIIDALRTPTADEPWRVLLSACLSGTPCGVDGTDYGLGNELPSWVRSPLVRVFTFCPENHKMGTPRGMPDMHGGDGYAVLNGTARVLDEHRNDLTEAMRAGARAMLELAQAHEIDFALMTDRSGACGSQVISVGCRFEEPIDHRKGVGVATALLLRRGIHVVSQRDFASLELLRAKVEPGYQPDPEARDHHNHPWVLDNLPMENEA